MTKDIDEKEASEDEEDVEKKVKLVKSAADLQRIKLEKLMRQPEKPVYIPEKRKEKKMVQPPEFIRNAWGSSAGAGSGDFHVYRGIRRREYARQKFRDEKAEKEEKDEDYQRKLEENKRSAEERTAKKRAKRLKKKKNSKKKKNNPNSEIHQEEEDEESQSDPEDVAEGLSTLETERAGQS